MSERYPDRDRSRREREERERWEDEGGAPPPLGRWEAAGAGESYVWTGTDGEHYRGRLYRRGGVRGEAGVSGAGEPPEVYREDHPHTARYDRSYERYGEPRGARERRPYDYGDRPAGGFASRGADDDYDGGYGPDLSDEYGTPYHLGYRRRTHSPRFGAGAGTTRTPGQGYGTGYGAGPGGDAGDRAFDRESWMMEGPYTGRGPRGYRRADDAICDEVCERLTQHGQLDAGGIDVRVENGEVTLSGDVPDRASKRRAERAAETVSGVIDVHNRLRIAGGATIVGSEGGGAPPRGEPPAI